MANEISLELREKVKNFALEAVKEADDEIELVDVAFYKQYGKLTVEALLWKKSGIDLNDCEEVHNVLSAKLDTIDDEFDDDYVLNVSSQGLDLTEKSSPTTISDARSTPKSNCSTQTKRSRTERF